MEGLTRNRLFVALTRPQMFAGVTYSLFVLNMVLAAQLFLIFRSLWVIAPLLVSHCVGALLCLHEPRAVDLWLLRTRNCPRIRNYRLWRCNSYQP
jgi:type IV secretion system protein VirB3